VPLVFFLYALNSPFKIGSAEGHLNMASATETSNAFCNNNAFIVYAAKLQSAEIQMFEGETVSEQYLPDSSHQRLETAARLLQFWH